MRAIVSLALLSLALIAVAGPRAASADVATPWLAGYNSKSRLTAGLAAPPEGGPLKLFVGVELVLEPGWKTYWRMPGDAGGLPPTFATAGSVNLGTAEVHYPVPQRLVDPAGTSLGYKSAVVFPIAVTPRSPGQPITLELALEYGICREICVPAEAKHRIVIPVGVGVPANEALQKAVQKVPVPPGADRPRDPRLASAKLERPATGPRLSFVVEDPAAGEATDLFVEAPDGIFLPLPARARTDGKAVTFVLDLADGVEVAEISGKPLTLTLVGGAGQAEAQWLVPLIPGP